MNAKVLQNVVESSTYLRFGFLSTSGIHEFVSVGSGAPRQRRRRFQTHFQNMELQTIQTVFGKVQEQICNLKLRDEEIYGPSHQVDWTDGHWKNTLLFDDRISVQLKSKVYVLSDSVLCLGGKCPDFLESVRIFGKDQINYFVESPEYRPFYDLTGALVEFVWKNFVEANIS